MNVAPCTYVLERLLFEEMREMKLIQESGFESMNLDIFVSLLLNKQEDSDLFGLWQDPSSNKMLLNTFLRLCFQGRRQYHCGFRL